MRGLVPRAFTWGCIIMLFAAMLLGRVQADGARTPTPPFLRPIAQLGGRIAAIAADQSIAYVGVGPRVVALDLSDPMTPIEIGRSAPLPGVVQDLALGDGVIYVAAEDAGVHVLNRIPAIMSPMAHVPTAGAARRLSLSNGWLYVAEGEGLCILDVSEPAAPIKAGHTALGQELHDLAGGEGVLYAADDEGLLILETATPTAPAIASRYLTTSPARSIAMRGSLVLLGEGNYDRLGVTGQVHAIDVSAPTAPVELDATTVGGMAQGLIFVEQYALVACGQAGIWALDIADPAEMRISGQANTTGSASRFCTHGAHVLVADGLDLGLLDASDMEGPAPVGSCALGSARGGGIAVAGDYVFVTEGEGDRFYVIDAGDTARPVIAGITQPALGLGRLHVEGQYAYLLDASGLTVLDISKPSTPTVVATCDTLASGLDSVVVAEGDRVYCAGGDGLEIVDVSKPDSPQVIGALVTEETSCADTVTISGTHAIVGRGERGLIVIDVSDPEVPALVGSTTAPGYREMLHAIDGYVLVADGFDGLRVMDVRDPSAPVAVAGLDLPGWTYDVTAIGGLGFCLSTEYSTSAGRANWLYAVDLSNPLDPRPVGAHCLAITTGGSIDRHALAVQGSVLYVLVQGRGVELYSLTQPSGPTIVSSLLSSWDISGLSAGPTTLTALNGSQVYAIDASLPATPTVTGSTGTPMWPQQVAQSDTHAYVTGWSASTSGFMEYPGVSGWVRTIALQGRGAPALVGYEHHNSYATEVQGVHVADGVACVSIASFLDPEFVVYDLGENGIPTERGRCDLDHLGQYCAVDGEHAVVVGEGAMSVIQLIADADPMVIGTTHDLNAPQGVTLRNDKAYVADGAAGLSIIDLSEPSLPRAVGRCDVGDDAGNVALNGPYAYVGVRDTGVAIVDISDPANPQLAATQPTPGNANCLAVFGNHLAVGDGPAGLTLYEPAWRVHLPWTLAGD